MNAGAVVPWPRAAAWARQDGQPGRAAAAAVARAGVAIGPWPGCEDGPGNGPGNGPGGAPGGRAGYGVWSPESDPAAAVVLVEMAGVADGAAAEGQPTGGRGPRVLLIGDRCGFVAGALAELLGPGGRVVSVVGDPEFAARAQGTLHNAGYRRGVEVVCDDPQRPRSQAGLFDRIVVLAGTGGLDSGWWHRLVPGGRIVVPLRLHASGLSRLVALTRVGLNTGSGTQVVPIEVDPARTLAGDPPPPAHRRLGEDMVLSHGPDDTVQVGRLAEPGTAGALRGAAGPGGSGLGRWERPLRSAGLQRSCRTAPHLDLWLAEQARRAGAAFARLDVPGTAGAGEHGGAGRRRLPCLIRNGSLACVDTGELRGRGVVAVGDDAADLGCALERLLVGWQDVVCGRKPTITVRWPASGDAATATEVRW